MITKLYRPSSDDFQTVDNQRCRCNSYIDISSTLIATTKKYGRWVEVMRTHQKLCYPRIRSTRLATRDLCASKMSVHNASSVPNKRGTAVRTTLIDSSSRLAACRTQSGRKWKPCTPVDHEAVHDSSSKDVRDNRIAWRACVSGCHIGVRGLLDILWQILILSGHLPCPCYSTAMANLEQCMKLIMSSCFQS